MGLKGMGMGGSFTFILWMCLREMVICRDLQFGAEWCKDRFKLGDQFMFDFLHWGLHGCIYGCIYGCIDGGNIGTTGTSYINKFPDFMKASPVPADLDSTRPPSPFLSSHYNFPRSGHDSNLNPLDTSERITPSQFSSLSQQTLSPLPPLPTFLI